MANLKHAKYRVRKKRCTKFCKIVLQDQREWLVIIIISWVWHRNISFPRWNQFIMNSYYKQWRLIRQFSHMCGGKLCWHMSCQFCYRANFAMSYLFVGIDIGHDYTDRCRNGVRRARLRRDVSVCPWIRVKQIYATHSRENSFRALYDSPVAQCFS